MACVMDKNTIYYEYMESSSSLSTTVRFLEKPFAGIRAGKAAALLSLRHGSWFVPAPGAGSGRTVDEVRGTAWRAGRWLA